jgi:hypothetical protein
MEKLAATSPAGVLLDLSGVLILLLAFACLASKLFNRYVSRWRSRESGYRSLPAACWCGGWR